MSKERKKAGRKQFLDASNTVVSVKINAEFQSEFKDLVLELRKTFLETKNVNNK